MSRTGVGVAVMASALVLATSHHGDLLESRVGSLRLLRQSGVFDA